jgi:hypothetical protein
MTSASDTVRELRVNGETHRVTYLSLSVPPIAAGFSVPLTGFLGTTQAYLGAVLAVSATATVLQWLPSRSRGAPA